MRGALLLFTLAAAGCRGRLARIAVIVSENDAGHVFLFDPSGTSPGQRALEQFADIRTGITIDRGRAAVIIVRAAVGASEHELWRVRATGGTLRPVARLASGTPTGLVSVSDDGSVALLESSQGQRSASVFVYRASRGGFAEAILALRYISGSDMTPDGRRALVSGAPASCVSTALSGCSLVIYALDLTEATPIPRIVADGPRANYQPRFVPETHGDEFAYQTTENDPSPACATSLNACRHDIMMRDWAGVRAPQVLRRDAIGVNYSPTGQRVAYLTHREPEARCPTLPCSRASLHVGRIDGEGIRRLVTAGVMSFNQHFWSWDDEWLAYAGEGHGPGIRRILHTVRRDGGHGRAIPNAFVIGWIDPRAR